MPDKRSVHWTVDPPCAFEEEFLIAPAQGVGQRVGVSRNPIIHKDAVKLHGKKKELPKELIEPLGMAPAFCSRGLEGRVIDVKS